jgi:hypothetical protein
MGMIPVTLHQRDRWQGWYPGFLDFGHLADQRAFEVSLDCNRASDDPPGDEPCI